MDWLFFQWTDEFVHWIDGLFNGLTGFIQWIDCFAQRIDILFSELTTLYSGLTRFTVNELTGFTMNGLTGFRWMTFFPVHWRFCPLDWCSLHWRDWPFVNRLTFFNGITCFSLDWRNFQWIISRVFLWIDVNKRFCSMDWRFILISLIRTVGGGKFRFLQRLRFLSSYRFANWLGRHCHPLKY